MKKLIRILFLIGALGVGYGIYTYNKPHTSMKKMKSEVEVAAKDIQSAYELDESQANEKYLGKVVTIEGEIQEISNKEEGSFLILKTNSMMASVKCQLDHLTEHPSLTQLKKGESVKLKGICTGYLMDVIIERAIIIQ